MALGTYQAVVNIGGTTTRQMINKAADHPNNYVGITLPVATEMLTFLQAGTGTLSSGHGLLSGTYDVYWADGVRYGVAITIVADDVTVMGGGAGDALPANATTVNISEQVDIDTAIDGDDIVLISLNSSLRSHIHFKDVGAASIYATELIGNEPQVWHDTNGLANPYTGNPITAAVASNGETSGAATLDILSLEDSTP